MPTFQNICRLCCYETTDTIEIFSEKGLEHDYKTKINKYLYLKVSNTDNQPKTVCWMCSQHLETFHRFFEKINEIQQKNLKDDYENFVLHPIYNDNESKIQLKSAEENFEISDYKTDSYSHTTDTNNDVDDNFVKVILFDSTTNDPNDQEETQHIVVQKTDDEINDNDEVETYVIYKNHNPSTDSCSDDVLLDENDVISMAESNVAEHNIEAMPDNEDDEIIPIPISDNEDYENVEIKTELKIETKSKQKRKRKNNENSSVKPKVRRCSERKSITKCESMEDSNKLKSENEPHRKGGKTKKQKLPLMRSIHPDIPMHEPEEGDSGDELPARDEDNDDWPAQQTLDEFPQLIIDDNGQLLVRGKKLMTLICKFYKLSCEICDDSKIRYRQLNDLFVHYAQEHKIQGYVKCCQTPFIRYPAIVMHMARHLQPDIFRCNICGYMVTRPRFLESHQQTHLPEEQKPFGCDKCPRRFCWKGALQIHMISHQALHERKQYTCLLCGKKYDTPGGLSTHKKIVHIDKHKRSQTNVCHLCAKTFATRTNLHEHMSTIHQPREKDQQQCIECGKWLMNIRCLKSHMVLHSDVELRCDVCDYVTKKQHLLKRHLLTQHSDLKPFKCEICKKSFKIKRALTVHISQHNSTKKTYKCTFCERVFNSSTNFYTHRKQMHPSELHALTKKKLEIQRQKRIRVGREEGRVIDGLNLDDEKLLNDDHHVAAYCHTEQEIIINEDAVNNNPSGKNNELETKMKQNFRIERELFQIGYFRTLETVFCFKFI